jgi:uncharacterized protein
MDQRTDIELVYKKIKDFLNLLEFSNIPIEKALLYGSFAKGNAHKDSDIDLALISERWEPDFFDAQYNLMRLAQKIDSRIEPRPINRSEIDDPDPFIKEILKTGKVINLK